MFVSSSRSFIVKSTSLGSQQAEDQFLSPSRDEFEYLSRQVLQAEDGHQAIEIIIPSPISSTSLPLTLSSTLVPSPMVLQWSVLNTDNKFLNRIWEFWSPGGANIAGTGGFTLSSTFTTPAAAVAGRVTRVTVHPPVTVKCSE
jgi:hypothetical protein